MFMSNSPMALFCFGVGVRDQDHSFDADAELATVLGIGQHFGRDDGRAVQLDLDHVKPTDFTLHTAVELLGDRDPWADAMPAPQRLPEDLVAEGRTIPVARVQAMHEGKRRARARRA